MPWDDTIAEAMDENTAALTRLAKVLERIADQWQPVIDGLLEEQDDERTELAKRTTTTRMAGDTRRSTRSRRLLPVGHYS